MHIYDSYIIIYFFKELIVFTVNEHENICIAGLNRWAGYTHAAYATFLNYVGISWRYMYNINTAELHLMELKCFCLF